jgi:hypothetical protein
VVRKPRRAQFAATWRMKSEITHGLFCCLIDGLVGCWVAGLVWFGWFVWLVGLVMFGLVWFGWFV